MPTASSVPASSPEPHAGSPDPRRFHRDLSRVMSAPAAFGGLCIVAALVFTWTLARPGPARVILALVTGAIGLALVLIAAWTRRRATALADTYLAAHERAAREASAAAATQTRLAGIIDSAMDAIITIDSRMRIVVFNQMAEQVFGWTAEEMMGQPLDRLLPEHLRTAHAAHVGDFDRTGSTSRRMGRPGQLVGVRRDGRVIPIEASISKAEIGNERLLTVVLRDVSERLRAEEGQRRQNEQLARSARRLESVREIDNAILSSARLDELVTSALRRIAPLLGADEIALSVVADDGGAIEHRVTPSRTPDAEVSMPPPEVDAALDAWIASRGGVAILEDLAEPGADVPPAVRQRCHEGRRSYLATTLRGSRGAIGRLEACASPPFAFGEEAREIVAEVRDLLTVAIEQAQLREDLQRHAQELEERVAERTRALEDVNAELNSFAYSVSHDLRAPLRSTQGFAEALLEDYGDKLDEVGQDYARRIVGASRRMDELIQDLLAYSRLSRAEVELQPVDLNSIARSAAETVADVAHASGPRIDIQASLPPVVGHRGVLSQVLQNLIGNAVKFVPPGRTPNVRVEAEQRDGHVTISVTDNGIGISPQYQERIFRVFERLHAVEAYPGTGIGLAIVRKGVERLGGRCGVESREGEGSRFWVELPAATSPVVNGDED